MNVGFVRKIVVTGLIGVLAGAVQTTTATVLIDEGFEGYDREVEFPSNIWTNYLEEADIIPGTNIFWAEEGTSPFLRVSDTTYGTNVAHLIDNYTSTVSPIMHYYFPPTTNALSISFDYKLNTLYGYPAFMIGGMGKFGSFNQYKHTALQIESWEDTLLRSFVDSSKATSIPLLELDLGRWYHIEIQTSPIVVGKETYDISITPFYGETAVFTNLLFRDDVDNYGNVRILNNAQPPLQVDFEMDNLLVLTDGEALPALVSNDGNNYFDTFEPFAVGDELRPPWSLSGIDSNAYFEVVADNSDFTNYPGSNALAFVDNSVDVTPSAKYFLPAATTNQLQIEFDFKPLTGAGWPSLVILDSTNEVVAMLGLVNNNSEIVNDLSGSTPVLLSTTTGTWYHIEMLTSEAVGVPSYDITITPFGGAPTVVTDLPFRSPAVGGYATVRFFQNSPASTANTHVILDNIRIRVPALVKTPYELWIAGYGVSGTNAAYYANPDLDSLLNIAEWALGGNPTVADTGLPFSSSYMNDKLVYTYPSNTVADDLIYSLVAKTDLTSPAWTGASYSVVGESGADTNGYSYVTNEISTAVEDTQFINLEIGVTP